MQLKKTQYDVVDGDVYIPLVYVLSPETKISLGSFNGTVIERTTYEDAMKGYATGYSIVNYREICEQYQWDQLFEEAYGKKIQMQSFN